MKRFPTECNGHDEFQYAHLVDHGCRAGRRNPDEAQADFLAFIASQPDAFHFSYEYLKILAEERLAHGHAPLRVPTLIEFIELLEFRESELLRAKAATGEDLYWRWPSSWPAKPSWNSHVRHSLSDVEGALVDRTKLHDYMLVTTRRGIALNKILAGHGAPVAVDYESSLQISRMLTYSPGGIALAGFRSTRRFGARWTCQIGLEALPRRSNILVVGRLTVSSATTRTTRLEFTSGPLLAALQTPALIDNPCSASYCCTSSRITSSATPWVTTHRQSLGIPLAKRWRSCSCFCPFGIWQRRTILSRHSKVSCPTSRRSIRSTRTCSE